MKPVFESRAIILALILGASASQMLHAQRSAPRDIILLLDTSSGMGQVYQEVSAYITGDFLRSSLRVGDTFHLIVFSDKPRLDISRRVEGRGDAEIIIGRMFLHYPLEPQADIPAALDFAERYILSLPRRPKKLTLVSGTHTAAPANLLAETRTRLSRQNTEFEFIQAVPGRPIGNPPAAPSRQTQATPAPAARPAVPQEPPAPQKVQVQEPVPEPAVQEPVAQEPVVQEPAVQEPVAQEPLVPEPIAQEPAVQKPAAQEPSAQEPVAHRPIVQGLLEKRQRMEAQTSFLLLLALLFGGLGLLISIIIILSRTIRGRSAEKMLLNLFVEDQNTFIGKRNTHILKPGRNLSIGGVNSDFLIFVAALPPRIAEVRRNGDQCTFTPLKPKYFPDLGSNQLPDCIGKTIRIITDKKYLLRIRLDRCED